VKLATWNCNGGFHGKIAAATGLGADVLVIQECASPDRWGHLLPAGSSVWWHPEGTHKGVAVVVGEGYEVQVHPKAVVAPSFRHVHPVLVTRPSGEELTVFAVWTMGAPRRADAYIAQVWSALDSYEQLLGSAAVLAGDFNSHPMWDGERVRNHTAVVDRLHARGVQSTYHRFFDCPASSEPAPTQFLYRHRDRPYHVDYIFASEDLLAWLVDLQVGTYDEWSPLSDHMPMVATFNLG
jgi:endonuclease/exonuclease/phosphatase family metal-dependent hydrolase